MQRLLKEIRENEIGCVIVKDMSRFSRDYIELGTYMNQIFPFMGVRFIAVNDHYDSHDHAGSTAPVDTAFQTLLYDLYSKDISVKVKTSFENKCANGEYVFGQVLFGYALDAVQAALYRQTADSIKEQISLLSAEKEKHGKELEQRKEEYRRTEEDMKQIIRYSHLEVLTEEVINAFINKIYVYKGKRVEIEWGFCENR